MVLCFVLFLIKEKKIPGFGFFVSKKKKINDDEKSLVLFRVLFSRELIFVFFKLVKVKHRSTTTNNF